VLLACGLGALTGAFAGVMVSLHGGTHREATPEHPVEPRGGGWRDFDPRTPLATV
jgi:hypothetical protein